MELDTVFLFTVNRKGGVAWVKAMLPCLCFFRVWVSLCSWEAELLRVSLLTVLGRMTKEAVPLNMEKKKKLFYSNTNDLWFPEHISAPCNILW